jgi:hypothetical protein
VATLSERTKIKILNFMINKHLTKEKEKTKITFIYSFFVAFPPVRFVITFLVAGGQISFSE